MKVSILSPVYNEEDYIEEMVASVLRQTHTDVELVIVDDGSSDDTIRLVAGLAANDARVKLIEPGRKLGKVAAFNRAFAESSGDAIVLLGGDDTLPTRSIETRVQGIYNEVGRMAAAFYRLRTVSQSKRHDGIVIPRKGEGNYSGGTCVLTRTLASRIFPLPTELIAEDVWLAENVRLLASNVAHYPDVVLNYRIHSGNSNPRDKSFPVMREQMYLRARPYSLLLDGPPVALSEEQSSRLAGLRDLSERRYGGDTIGILLSHQTPLITRLRMASMSNPWLYKLRNRLFRVFSGR